MLDIPLRSANFANQSRQGSPELANGVQSLINSTNQDLASIQTLPSR
jgi:hypothetical protein